jgi:hypothetical protein
LRIRIQSGWLLLPLLGVIAAAGCAPKVAPTLFVPPTQSYLLVPPATATPAPLQAGVPTIVPPSPTPPCTNDLTYLQDLSIPDGTNVTPGQQIVKEWQVANSGTCNWDKRYGLKLIRGDAMGASPLLPLYPARAGTQATIRITFTAPQTEGLYECQWQAVDPDGQLFGQAFYMQISVAP